MEIIKNLKSEVEKYLVLRKIFRVIEIIASLGILISSSTINSAIITTVSIIACLLVVPEFLLLIYRIELKNTIKNLSKISEDEFKLYYEMVKEVENLRNEFISKGSEKSVPDECKKLVWKEEMGIGWLSIKIKNFESKCKEARQIIEELKSIKRLVIF